MPEIDPAWWTSGSFHGRPLPQILASRDFGSVFAFLRSRGWSVGALSDATQLDGYPIREIIKGKREVTKYEVIERIVEGLQIERHMCGVGTTIKVDEEEPTNGLGEWLSSARSVDEHGLQLLAAETDHLRRVDRLLGAAVADRQLKGHMETLTSLRDFSLRPSSRERLSDLICDAAALAGWVALDLGEVDRAWRYHEAAKVAGRETGSTEALAHALAQQAYVLIEIDHRQEARELAEYAVTVAGQSVSPVLAAWLAAVDGELAAIDGDPARSHGQFDRAMRLLPDNATDPAVPYIMLDSYHLARWRGSAAARLGDSSAIAALEYALGGMDSTFIRARAQLHVELAYSFIAVKQRGEAARQVADAKLLAGQVGSVRQRRRIRWVESVLAESA